MELSWEFICDYLCRNCVVYWLSQLAKNLTRIFTNWLRAHPWIKINNLLIMSSVFNIMPFFSSAEILLHGEKTQNTQHKIKNEKVELSWEFICDYLCRNCVVYWLSQLAKNLTRISLIEHEDNRWYRQMNGLLLDADRFK